MRWLGAALVLLMVSGCAAAPSRSAMPPGLDAWPPFPTSTSPPPVGLSLNIGPGRVARFSNHSDGILWIREPGIEIWEGPDQWREYDELGDVVPLAPGEEITRSLPDLKGRIGVRVWASPDVHETNANLPWFIWTLIPASRP